MSYFQGMIAIARKELNIYFNTLIAYSGLGALAFILGLVFISTLNRFQQVTEQYLAQQQPELIAHLNFNEAIIAPILQTGVWLFLFFIPFLTMRQFAEETQNRTLELLLTAPISSWEIVAGKFLALALLILIMSGFPLIFPVILSLYGSGTSSPSGVEWAPVWSGAVSLLWVGLSFTAMGLLISAWTQSQLVAALLTFSTLLLSFVLPSMAARLEGTWHDVIEYISPITHVSRGIEGHWALKDLVFFMSTTATLLFLTLRTVESQRWR